MDPAIALLDKVYRAQLESLPAGHIDTLETLYELTSLNSDADDTTRRLADD